MTKGPLLGPVLANQVSTGVSDHVVNNCDSLLLSGDSTEVSFAQDEAELQFPMLGDNLDLWDDASFGYSSWVFMPPISQLESFPLPFEVPI